jgi:hypothetical protein
MRALAVLFSRKPRPSGGRLRSCPPRRAAPAAPPLLHSVGHPTPLAATGSGVPPVRVPPWWVDEGNGYRAQRSKGGAAGCAADCGGGHERSPVPVALVSPQTVKPTTAPGRVRPKTSPTRLSARQDMTGTDTASLKTLSAATGPIRGPKLERISAPGVPSCPAACSRLHMPPGHRQVRSKRGTMETGDSQTRAGVDQNNWPC